MRAVNWFFGGLGGVAGLAIAAITAAAPGDLIYEETDAAHAQVTAAAAVACVNTLLGTSYGAGDLNELHIFRGSKVADNGTTSEQYYAVVRALKTAAAASVPLGARVVGRVQ